jgi:hypothetical protein
MPGKVQTRDALSNPDDPRGIFSAFCVRTTLNSCKLLFEALSLRIADDTPRAKTAFAWIVQTA